MCFEGQGEEFKIVVGFLSALVVVLCVVCGALLLIATGFATFREILTNGAWTFFGIVLVGIFYFGFRSLRN